MQRNIFSHNQVLNCLKHGWLGVALLTLLMPSELRDPCKACTVIAKYWAPGLGTSKQNVRVHAKMERPVNRNQHIVHR